MTRERCEKLVVRALEGLPEVFRRKLTNVAIVVEDQPPTGMSGDWLILGMFCGIPCTEKSVFLSAPPDRIYLYQESIEAVCASEQAVCRQIRKTLLHEVGHYFGMSEEELRNA
jgi:predicted Zn-dependent protease with MMP-like domain